MAPEQEDYLLEVVLPQTIQEDTDDSWDYNRVLYTRLLILNEAAAVQEKLMQPHEARTTLAQWTIDHINNIMTEEFEYGASIHQVY